MDASICIRVGNNCTLTPARETCDWSILKMSSELSQLSKMLISSRIGRITY